MDAQLLIRLVDQVTAPAQKVRGALSGIKQQVSGMKEAAGKILADNFNAEGFAAATERFSGRLNKAQERFTKASDKFAEARGQLIGAAGTMLALGAPIKMLGNFEERMISFGNTAGIFGNSLKDIERELRTLAPAINLTAGDALTGLEYLVGKGLDPKVALNALRSVGMTATATGATIEDMSSSAFSVINNLKVPVGDIQNAFDAMAQAGKNGGFELNSMAQYFPNLTASAEKLGMTGVRAVAELAAALQVARNGAGSDGEAANNMQNFLAKLTAPETVKRMAEAGIDLRKEMEKAEKAGVSFFEHMSVLIAEKTKDDPFGLGELFGDMQVQNFLKPITANLAQYREIRDAALKAQGVNAADYARVVDGLNAKLKALVIQLDNAVTAGSPLLDVGKGLVDQLSGMAAATNSFASANPELTKNIVYAVAGLMAFSAGMKVVRFAFSGLRLGMAGLSVAFNGARLALLPLWRAFLFFEKGKNIAPGWRLLAGTFRGIGASAGLAARAVAAIATRLSSLKGMMTANTVITLGFEIFDDMGRTPEERLAKIKSDWESFSNLEKKAEESSFGKAWQGTKDKVNSWMGLKPGEVPAEALAGWGKRTWNSLSNLESKADASSFGKAWQGTKDKVNSWMGLKPGEVPAEAMAGWGKRAWETIPSSLPALKNRIMAPNPPDLAQTIKAEIVDNRPPQVTMNVSAPITVNGVTDPKAVASAVQQQLSSNLMRAKGAAIHGVGE